MSENDTPALRTGIASVACKMAKVMGLLKDVPKSGWHAKQQYAYLTGDDVYSAIRQAMAEANLALHVTMIDKHQIDFTTGGGTKGTRSSVDLKLTLICGDTGESLSADWTGVADTFGESSDKGIDKAAGLGVKSCLKKMFLVSSDDTEGTAGPAQQKQQSKQAPTPAGGAPKPPAWWREVVDTVKELPHFAGIAAHAMKALNKMLAEGAIHENWTAAKVIAAVKTKYAQPEVPERDLSDIPF